MLATALRPDLPRSAEGAMSKKALKPTSMFAIPIRAAFADPQMTPSFIRRPLRLREGDGVVNGRECLVRSVHGDESPETRVLHVAQLIAVYGCDGVNLQRVTEGNHGNHPVQRSQRPRAARQNASSSVSPALSVTMPAISQTIWRIYIAWPAPRLSIGFQI